MRFSRLLPFHASSCIPVFLSCGLCHAELVATFESGGSKDERIDRIPALYVKTGESPTSFLPAGEFTTTWTGKISLPARQRLVFSFEGEGSAVLSIAGEEVLAEEGELGKTSSKSTRLNRGEHEISITYRSKPDGSGRFRLFWEESSFVRQSIPPAAFQAEVSADLARQGRLLFAENHCSKCHIPSSLGTKPMLELSETAPILFASGSRLKEEWIARWIADPSALRPDTRMPALVDASTEDGKQQAADLAAWLMTFKMGETPAAPDPQVVQKGGEHFHNLGCVACHTSPAETQLDGEHGRIPLHHVSSKFQPGALAGFLKKPHEYYSSIGMPDFALSEEESSALAAFLLDASTKASAEETVPAFPKGDAARGADLATQLNCGACHAGSGIPNFTLTNLESLFEKDWSAAGCVSTHRSAKTPHLALTEQEREALIAFSKKGPDSLKRHIPAEYASAKLSSLNCTACHSMDGKPSLLESVHGQTSGLVSHVPPVDEKLDQTRPQLTLIGEMLHASYIEKMLNGTVEQRPRPWLDMRMPAFHAYGPALAEGLARLHGLEPGSPSEEQPDAELAAIGKQLVGTEGFGCVTCHGVGSQKPTSLFDVEGVNLALAHERLRKEWFMRWMDNPPSITPSTKMPRYSQDGESQRGDVLEGDASKQFDAIWNFLMKPGME